MLIKRDEWLSEVLGKPCSVVTYDDKEQMPAKLPLGFQYVKLPLERKEALAKFLYQGFKIICVDVSMELKIVRSYSIPSSPIQFRQAKDEDREGVETISASTFSLDRFHVDPLIPDECADRLKKEWAGNYFEGKRGTNMFVAEENGQLIAFLQILMKGEELIIDLIGVAASHHRKGVGSSLIKTALNELGAQTAKVGTQLNNISSIRMYSSIGFQIETSVFSLHRHRETGGTE